MDEKYAYQIKLSLKVGYKMSAGKSNEQSEKKKNEKQCNIRDKKLSFRLS